MEQLGGIGVALVTPFNSDFTVDIKSLRAIVRYCINGGVDYLVVLGTTGESSTLSTIEKQLVMDTVIDENSEALPLVVGIGGNDTRRVAEELRRVNLDPFTAVLSVSPFYNKPTQQGIYQHFKTLSEASSKPIILYNVPGRTGSNIEVQTVVRLATDCDNIVAIKEASGDMDHVQAIIQNIPNTFKVISGDDFTALPTVLAGGIGVISVLGQGMPSKYCKMIRLGLQGEGKLAYKLHHVLKEGMELIFEEGSPAGIKVIFETLGISTAVVRLPLIEASKDLKTRIGAFMKSFSKIHA